MSQTDPGVSCLKIGVAHIEVHPALESVRTHAVRRGRRLTWATIAYNCLEGLLSIGSGLLAGSVSLVGFGVDSFIEVSASLTAVWRLHIDRDAGRRARAERTAQRLIGFSFLALAGYVAIEATRSRHRHCRGLARRHAALGPGQTPGCGSAVQRCAWRGSPAN
jgi:hypothetical protein